MAGETNTLPLVDTKLHRLWVSDDLVLRPRLVDRLNRGLDRRLTLVCATAGYDKTTLLTQWLADSPRPAACPISLAAWAELVRRDNR